VVGNLPYQITGQAVRRILDHMRLLHGAVITVQREVAERMRSDPGRKSYGILSVATQYYSIPRMVLRIPKEAFSPRPQVVSTALFLEPRTAPPVEVRDEALFFASVRALFGHRRKTAGNALRNHPQLRLDAERLDDLSRRTGIDLGRRGETMSLSELAEISNALGEQQHADHGI
jgi:16S rRNA (adenine1518-N6/adenine1519-N6)-dimethyltransferase